MGLKFQRLDAKATLPSRGSEYSGGLDLHSIEDLALQPSERAAVRTGLAVAIPHKFYGRVAPRSGLALNQGIDVLAGVIDSDYRGEIRCVLINHGKETVNIKTGDRIAQLLIERIALLEPEWYDALTETARSASGFGSSGT
jgi:deoxyuridine 5'-triphosphate nucleotidohydrolase